MREVFEPELDALMQDALKDGWLDALIVAGVVEVADDAREEVDRGVGLGFEGELARIHEDEGDVQLLGVRGARRVAAAHFVIDETTAMAIARDDPRQSRYAFWATGFALFVFWNVGTLIGALATQAIPNPKVFGLDAAPPAAFLALLAPRLRSREPLAIALASAAAAIVLLPFVPAGVPLLVIAVLVALYGVMRRR